jgi:hypothetical protein
MSANNFLKEIKKLFGKVEYKATMNGGQVFKSKGYEDAILANKAQQRKTNIADW